MASVQNVKEAEAIIGGLSQTSKMPGLSYSIDPRACKTGSKLRQDPDSPCSKCYAMKGRYGFPNVRNALERRLKTITDPEWVNAMVAVLIKKMKPEVPYFRWFDAGDIQNRRHFRKMMKIATMLPWINFWLPTQEHDMIKDEDVPENVTVRISEKHYGFKKTRKWPTTSSVARKVYKDAWPDLVEQNTAKRWHCPAPLQEGECKSCRACWKSNIEHTIYLEH